MSTSTFRAPTHTIYVDESGDHLYKNLDEISCRYLTMLGCIFNAKQDYFDMNDRMLEIKQKFWPSQHPDRPVIFHREDILRKRPPFHILRDQWQLEEFNKDLLDLLTQSKYTIINVTIDKKFHLAQYKTPDHPYHYCLRVMLERYVFWLTEHGGVGDVMGESRGKEDLELSNEYHKIWLNGTTQQPPDFFQRKLTSSQIKIKPKISNKPGLQIADLLAYPLKEKMLYERHIRKNFVQTFNEIIYNAVESKIRRDHSGRIMGCGEIFIG